MEVYRRMRVTAGEYGRKAGRVGSGRWRDWIMMQQGNVIPVRMY
jgi:hypothetical protein